MKTWIAIFACLLLGTLPLFGQQDLSEGTPDPATQPPATDMEAATAEPPKAASYASTENTGSTTKQYNFYTLKDDENARSYYEYYDVRSYGTPSGYINPNYQFPSREDIDEKEKVDEAMQKHIIDGGKSMEEVLKLYYPEQHDVFWQMDQVADPETGELHPLSLDRRGVIGRNTWIMWCGGNEWFWDWLASEGVGLLDLLHLLDSRQHDLRFAKAGLWNQPGMAKNAEPGPWGLYLDKVDKPLTDRNGKPLRYDYPPLGDGKKAIYSDGVDPYVYGYPSGVIGLRLFPNPNFDEEAKAKWDPKAFYEDRDYRSNPDLERPLRVGLSCAICHVAAHPLNPPADPAKPVWENLSAIIGNLNFRASAIFGNETHPTNFLNQFLASQQPGTVDTSMTSTDWVANFTAMNPVFEFQARINRSLKNPPEEQPERAVDLPQLFGEGKNPRKFPRVLMDGADSVGPWASLARVYLNIGLFGEQWNNVQNTIIGFTPRRPFRLDTLHTNSVNWNLEEAFRIHYSALYFNHRLVREGKKVRLSTPGEIYDKDKTFIESSTQAMHLKNALVNGKRFEEHADLLKQHMPQDRVAAGRKVFVRNCMVCHSSRQPEGYRLAFTQEAPGGKGWAKSKSNEPWPLALPYSYRDWEDFKKGPAYKAYLQKAEELAATKDDFFTNENYLSNGLRIPVSLVATNSQRALAENALAGEVWNDFSSVGYKNLPPVGEIEYYNTATGKIETFQPEGHGRGYYRTPTLVSIWATAPLLNTNALGKYIPDHQAARRVSVLGRLEMFDDAVEKLLWKSKRSLAPSGENGLRDPGDAIWHGNDPSWIYRTDQVTSFKIDALQIRGVVVRLIEHLPFLPRVLGKMAVFFVDQAWILPLIFALIVGLLAWKWRRWAAYLAILTGVMVLLTLYISGLNYILPIWADLFGLVLIAAGVTSIVGIKYPVKSRNLEGRESEPTSEGTKQTVLRRSWASMAAPMALWVLCLVLFGGLTFANLKLSGQAGKLKVGPFPKGMPVSSFMSQDTDAPILRLVGTFRGLFRCFGAINSNPDLSDEEALELFNRYAMPGLLKISKCPDWELDKGHYFGEYLSDEEKIQLISFLKTL